MVARIDNIKMAIDSDGKPIKATVVIQIEGEQRTAFVEDVNRFISFSNNS